MRDTVDDREFAIYGIFDLNCDRVYVGLSVDVERRYAEHCGLREAHGAKCLSGHSWVKSARLEILEQVFGNCEAHEREKWWIAKFKRAGYELANSPHDLQRADKYNETVRARAVFGPNRPPIVERLTAREREFFLSWAEKRAEQ